MDKTAYLIMIVQILCQRKKESCFSGLKPYNSMSCHHFAISGDLGKIRKCQEIDAAGEMHRFGDMGV
jgi:hypothetical protein